MTRLLIIALSALIAAPVTAYAGSQCGPHAGVVAVLAKKYGETVRSMGLTGQGTMIEVFASDTGSWTIVQTAPMGTACIIASGGAFETVKGTLPLSDLN